jgi:hypothetical protein
MTTDDERAEAAYRRLQAAVEVARLAYDQARAYYYAIYQHEINGAAGVLSHTIGETDNEEAK